MAKQQWDVTLRYRFNHRYSVEFKASNNFDESPRELIRGGQLIESRSYGASYAISFIGNLSDLEWPILGRK